MTDEERAGDAADRSDTDESATDDRDPASDPFQSMTDDTNATDHTATDSDRTAADGETDPDDSGTDRLSTDDLRGLLDRVGLAALSLLAVVAGWGFYSQSGDAIRIWFDSAYQSVALAMFNLAVLLVALAGVTHQLRRIRASGGDEPEE